MPLFRPCQKRLRSSSVTGQRARSSPPPTGSKRITSAPSWASVMPPSGAATYADPSITPMPSRIVFTPSAPRSASRGPPASVRVRARSSTRPSCLFSTVSSVASTSPSNTGPRWSQLRQARIVTRLGSARVACAAAIPIVCPPYTSRLPCLVAAGSVGLGDVEAEPSEPVAAVTVSRPSISYTAPGSMSGPGTLAEHVEVPVARHGRLHARRIELLGDVVEAVGVPGFRIRVAQRDHRAAPEVEHRLVVLVDGRDPERDQPGTAPVLLEPTTSVVVCRVSPR